MKLKLLLITSLLIQISATQAQDKGLIGLIFGSKNQQEKSREFRPSENQDDLLDNFEKENKKLFKKGFFGNLRNTIKENRERRRKKRAERRAAKASKKNGKIIQPVNDFVETENCYQKECVLYILIDKSSQRMTVYFEGQVDRRFYDRQDERYSIKVSTGLNGMDTPNFDRKLNGRIYNGYSSKKFPGGDYAGLGNMPYAMFIKGGYAMHGTPQGNWSRLGQKASHGCIRMHPSYAKVLNQLVREVGIDQTHVTIVD